MGSRAAGAGPDRPVTIQKDIFDTERYERIREIAAEMLAHQTEIPLEKVKDLFCNETGYQTPKN